MIKGKYILGSRNDPGDVRRNNEDRVWVGEIERNGWGTLIVGVVADGVGSAEGAAGAQMAIDVVKRKITNSNGDDIPQILIDAIGAANLAVYNKNEEVGGNGLTTLVACIISNDRCYIGNVGDSRAYWIESGTKGKGKISQLTKDHNYYNIYGGVDPESQEGEVLVNYIGKKPDVFVDIDFYLKDDSSRELRISGAKGMPLKPGDSILLCSDGLIKKDRLGNRYAEDDEIVNALITESESDKAAVKMVSAAVGRRPDDNVSAVTIQYLSSEILETINANQRREKTTLHLRQALPLFGILVLVIIGIFSGKAYTTYTTNLTPVVITNTPPPTLQATNTIFVSSPSDTVGRLINPNGSAQDLVNGIYTISIGSRIETFAGVSNINLADGTVLYLSSGTIFVFTKIENGVEIRLEQGSIMSKLGTSAISLSIQSATGYTAQVRGSIMGVQFISVPPGPGIYVDCFEGHCSIVGGNLSLQDVEAEDRYNFYSLVGATHSDQPQRCQYWNDVLGQEITVPLGIIFDSTEINGSLPEPTSTRRVVYPTPTKKRDDDGGNQPVATP